MSMEHQQGPSKKPYTTPVLTVHGSVQKLTESFGPSGDLKQLIVSVAASDSFRMRLAEGAGQ